MSKRGQAAMEFLMTYGWAILIVMAVVGALSYFGVFSSDQFLADKCNFLSAMSCADKAEMRSADHSIDLVLRNNVGYRIHIENLVLSNVKGVSCVTPIIQDVDADGPGPNYVLGINTTAEFYNISGGTDNWFVENNDVFFAKMTCNPLSAGWVPKSKFTGDVTVYYVNTETNNVHYAFGSIRGKVS